MSTSIDQSEPKGSSIELGHWRGAKILAGGLSFAFAAWLLFAFPFGRPWLLCLAVLVGIAQFRSERTWLIALPVLFGTLDLGAWSGRLLFSEQDAVLAVLVGSAFLAGHYDRSSRQLRRLCFAPLWLIAAAIAAGLARGLQAPLELDANGWNGYLTSWNAVRIAKGPLWALVFWPLLARQFDSDRLATEKWLAVGMALGLVGLGIFVLWERGLFLDLVQADSIYRLFSKWLDLSASYRITGPLSQMHLGGEAIDGYLILCSAFAWLLLFRTDRAWIFLLACVAVGLSSYAILMTFTRTTYAACAVALLTFACTALAAVPTAMRVRLVAVALYAVLAAGVFLYGFRLGGTVTIAAYLLIVLASIASGDVLQGRRWRLVSGLLILFAAALALATHGMASSKWNQVALSSAFATAVVSTALLAVGGLVIGHLLKSVASTRVRVGTMAGLSILLPLATLGFSSAQMEQRFASVAQDLAVRERHWNGVLALMPDDLSTTLVGMGLGRFPRNFLFSSEGSKGTWQLGHEGSGAFLRLLGTANLCFGQRVASLAPGVYRVEVTVRNPSNYPANIAIKLQPRRLLESERWQPATRQVNFLVQPNGPAWRTYAGELRLGPDSLPPWYDARFPVFALTNQGDPRSAMDVALVRLIDSTGRDRLDNGDFSAGGDRWFAYNDFEHLAWHAKNLYLALLFDMGLLGLIAGLVACFTGIFNSWRKALGSSLFGAATAAAIAGFLALGTTSTLLDVPQVMSLVVIIVTAALWRPATRRPEVRSWAPGATAEAPTIVVGPPTTAAKDNFG